jgi:hypothetical protein
LAGTNFAAADPGPASPVSGVYQDVTSGPVGSFLTVYGKGFGSSGTVTVGGVAQTPVLWSDTKVAVKVTGGSGAIVVNGVNTGLSYATRPGNVVTVTPGQSVQAAVDAASPGDHIVLRGGTYTDSNPRYNTWFTLQDGKSGTAQDPIVVRAYPGERVYVPRGTGNGVTLWNSAGGLTLVGVSIDMQGGSGAGFGWPPGAAGSFGGVMQNIRAVDNDFTGMVANSGGAAVMAGRGKHIKFLGNYVHDNGIVNGVGASSKLYHSIYFDNQDATGTDDIEIAYNHIARQGGGRGIQIYHGATRGITNVSVHHNLIHDIALDGILFGDATEGGMQVYNNVVYNTAVAAYATDGASGGCLRFNSPYVVAQVYNNTFANCAQDNDPYSAALRLDSLGQVTFLNNLMSSSGGAGYQIGSPSASALSGSANNLWFGSGAAPSWGTTGAVSSDPMFVNAATGNFRVSTSSPAVNKGSAAVSSLVITDMDGSARPKGGAYDIGAFEVN